MTRTTTPADEPEPGAEPPADARPETDVPADERPAARCPYCGRPFRAERSRALHVGEAHPGRCTDAEREAYERAREDESDDLFVFHLKVVMAIVLIYAVFVLAYMVVLSMGG